LPYAAAIWWHNISQHNFFGRAWSVCISCTVFTISLSVCT